MLELTHSTGSLTVPLLLAAGLATAIARLLGAPSIYSARLAEPQSTATARPAHPLPGQGVPAA